MSAERESALLAALGRGGIHFGIRGADREAVLAEIVERLGLPAGVDRKETLRSLLERDLARSTGLEHGLAIPHALVGADHLPVFGALGYPRTPVEWETLDGSPVRCVLCLAMGREHRKDYVRILSEVGRITTRDLSTLGGLAACRTPDEVLTVIRQSLELPVPVAPSGFEPAAPAIRARIAVNPASGLHTATITRVTESVQPFDAEARIRLLGQNLEAGGERVFVPSPNSPLARASEAVELLNVLLVAGAVLEVTVEGPEAEEAYAALTGVLEMYAVAVDRDAQDAKDVIHEAVVSLACILHARPTYLFTSVAETFECDVRLRREDGSEADGKRMMDIMTLSCDRGSTITISTRGPDAEQALLALVRVVEGYSPDE